MRKKVGVVPSDASCPQVGAFLAALGQELTSSDVDTHLSGCIGCGNCGNSCNWFLTTGNQRLHPKNRADLVRQVFGRYFTFAGRLGRFLGLTPETTIEDLEVIRDVVFASCTECGRCALACNQGVSNRRLVQLARHALVAAGITPPVITKILSDARTKQHSFGLTFEESLGRVVALGEAEGVDVPVDRLGADLLLGCSAILNSSADGPKVILEGIQLLQRAGISFTLSSRVIDTGTEAYTTAGDLDLGRQFMVRTAEEAVRLGAWGIMVGECGCDMRSHFVEAGHIFNSRGLRTVYIDALLLEAHKRGRLPLVQLPLSVTLHDPCWTSRLTGYTEEARELLRATVTDFVEMTPNRAANYCCNGGSGQLRHFPVSGDEMNLRRQASAPKAAQLKMTGAEIVATPCVTCQKSLADTIKVYGLPMQATLLMDLVVRSNLAAIGQHIPQEVQHA